MPLASIYRKGGGPTVSFDFIDLITGTAYQTFLLANTSDTGGDDSVLTSQSIFSDEIETVDVIPADTDVSTKIDDHDFDIPVNIPQTLEGEAIVNLNFTVTGAVAGTMQGFLIVKIIHYDGSTETTLATSQSETLSRGELKQLSFSMTVAKTRFVKGDTIRLNVESWGISTDAVTTANIAYGTDPRNREGTNLGVGETTIGYFYAPFDVQL